MTTILNFLKELKYSYHKAEEVYSQGSCFRLYKMLKVLFPTATAWYSSADGHWITFVDGRWYDINGEISSDYVAHKDYKEVKENTILESAYIPTYKRQTVSYSKYVKSV